MKKIQISPSILSADFSQLGKEIKRLEETKKTRTDLKRLKRLEKTRKDLDRLKKTENIFQRYLCNTLHVIHYITLKIGSFIFSKYRLEQD